MARKLFLTPATLPETDVCRSLSIPNSQAWLTVFSEALSQTIYAHNYEQVNETDLSPEAAAAAAYERYVTWLTSVCSLECPPIVQPGGQKIWRKHPTTGKLQYVDPETGEYVEPTGDDAIPPPAPRPELTDEQKKCNAAANAAHVIRLLYEKVLTDWNNDVEPEVAKVGLWTEAGLILGSVFYPPLAAVLELTTYAFTTFYKVMDTLTALSWTTRFENSLKCILLSNATVEGDGSVTFDFQETNKDILAQIWATQTDVILVGQVLFLNGVIGPEGLNIAGSTTDVLGNCSSCSNWAFEWTKENHLLGNGAWELFEGSLKANFALGQSIYGTGYDGALRRLGLRMTVPTVDTQVTWVGCRLFVPSGSATNYHYRYVSNSTGLSYPGTYPPGGYVTLAYSPGAAYDYNSGSDVSDTTTGTSSLIEIRLTQNGAPNSELWGVKLAGTGVCPWGAPNA